MSMSYPSVAAYPRASRTTAERPGVAECCACKCGTTADAEDSTQDTRASKRSGAACIASKEIA